MKYVIDASVAVKWVLPEKDLVNSTGGAKANSQGRKTLEAE
jgi:hypothetical protein